MQSWRPTLHSRNKRLIALEQKVQPTTVDFGTALVDALSCGMMRIIVALCYQRRHAEARELLEIAATQHGKTLSQTVADAALRHVEKHLKSHLAKYAQEPVRYWVRAEEKHHQWLRTDAAHLARNKGSDEAQEYAHLVESWNRRRGGTSEELIAMRDAEHAQHLMLIAQHLVQLRQARGQTKGAAVDVRKVFEELNRLEASVSPAE